MEQNLESQQTVEQGLRDAADTAHDIGRQIEEVADTVETSPLPIPTRIDLLLANLNDLHERLHEVKELAEAQDEGDASWQSSTEPDC